MGSSQAIAFLASVLVSDLSSLVKLKDIHAQKSFRPGNISD